MHDPKNNAGLGIDVNKVPFYAKQLLDLIKI